MNIVNFPSGDIRVADFYVELIDFIRNKGDGLPYPSIIGSIEMAKQEIMITQRDIFTKG